TITQHFCGTGILPVGSTITQHFCGTGILPVGSTITQHFCGTGILPVPKRARCSFHNNSTFLWNRHLACS
ncbi:hypothetical protein, partial [Microcoleus sp. D2_18a_B4]|uniref:hypothetical protein n=1 Tax=Microcoleus sp. D2_18a_B4 TaxID=3055329 RepID=UPI002FD2FBBD